MNTLPCVDTRFRGYDGGCVCLGLLRSLNSYRGMRHDAGVSQHSKPPGPTLSSLDDAERGAVNVYRKQVKLRLFRSPAYPLIDRISEALAHIGIVNVDPASVYFELALAAVGFGDDAVDCAARVAQQVQRLAGLPHHAQVQMAVRDVRLDGTDTRPPILAKGAKQDEA